MKVRTAFVANSSSSSFIIDKTHLSENQINKIRNHIEFAKNIPLFDDWTCEHDAWEVQEYDGFIKVYTIMDNFDMGAFLKAIHVKDEHYTWGEY